MSFLSKNSLSLFILLLFSSLFGSRSYAQAKMAPIALYMSDNNKTGRIVVRNTSATPIEVNVDLLFGYPTTDEEGNVYLKKFKEAPENEPSATNWIRIYPRHIVIPSRQQQTIRFAARPPADLPDGEYWARPAVSVRKMGGETNLGSSKQKDVSANLHIIQRTILSLNYRHGSVRTGIKIENLSSRHRKNTLYVATDLEREGNAAFLGHVDIGLLDSSGRRIKHHRQEIAVYHTQQRQFEFNTEGLAPGKYTIELSLDSKERHREKKEILNTRRAQKTATVTIK